jgi:hypothetical protein
VSEHCIFSEGDIGKLYLIVGAACPIQFMMPLPIHNFDRSIVGTLVGPIKQPGKSHDPPAIWQKPTSLPSLIEKEFPFNFCTFC